MSPRSALAIALLATGALVPGGARAQQDPATPSAVVAAPVQASADGSATPEGEGVRDPWESMNRGIFAFNEAIDRWAIRPVARGWAFVVPQFARESLSRAYRNVRTPVNMANNLLQGQPRQAAIDALRFILNSTLGIAGLLDPAQSIGLAVDPEDFGQTFGVWGIPSGPYLVLPVFGPSSPRDAVGLAADSATFAVSYFIPFWASIAVSSVDFANRYSLVVDEVDEERKAAFDWYAAVRNAYLSRRQRQVEDRAEPAEEEGEQDADELYYPEFDEY